MVMEQTRDLNDSHVGTRGFLRFIGLAMVAVGLVFTLVGVVNFFSAANGGGVPTRFWCVFVGLPLLGIGARVCKFAFFGATARYMANEVTPVGRDVVNHLAKNATDAVRQVATAAAEGVKASSGSNVVRLIRCHKCNADNELPVNFCKQCGAPLTKTRACAACKELNDPDARFCDSCGKPMAAT